MSGRHVDWLRWRFSSPAAQSLASAGRKLLGTLQEQLRFGGLRQGKLTHVLPDGTRIVAQHDGTTPFVTIVRPEDLDEPPAPTVRYAAWIPRGFVVYPTSDESRTGWGGPPLPASGATTWADENLRPGLDVARWTSEGKLGEVLLTRVRDAGYPRRRRNAIPAMFEATDVPRGYFIDAYGRALPMGTPTAPPQATTEWTAYRMEFEDAVDRETMQPDVLLRALWVAAVGGEGYLKPLRGFYDRAWRASSYVRTSDLDSETIVDADLPHAPGGYVKATERARHDGVMAHEREAITRFNGTISDVADELANAIALRGGDFEPGATTLHVADVGALRSLVAEERQQWIAYGARRWYPPAESGLPILSWDAFPFLNWHAQLVYQFTVGGVAGGVTDDLEAIEGPFRREQKPLFSKRLYAWGRVIGELPDTVLAAAIQRNEQGYRLIVLTWRSSDQLGTVWPNTVPGLRPFNALARLRVYFVDLARNQGMTMLLKQARVGEYDEEANPLGWRYAGLLRMVEDDRWMIPGSGSIAIRTYCPLQAPSFNAAGDTVIVAYERLMTAFFTTHHVVAMTRFVDVREGLLDVERTIYGGVEDDHFLSSVLPEPEVQISELYGADWAADGAPYPFAVVYEIETYEASSPLLDSQVIRTNTYTDGGPERLPTDLLLRIQVRRFATQAYVLDITRGVVMVLNHDAEVPGFQFVWVNAGSAQFSHAFPDPFGIPQIEQEPADRRQSANLAQPTYARRGEDYVFGFELAPSPTVWPVPPGAFLGAYYRSSIGDLVELTETPGGRVGFYPVGVV